MRDLRSRVEESQRRAFLSRACDVAGASAAREVASGELGQELGLPYEDTLRIVAELHARGWIHRYGALLPPRGPMFHLTRQGIRTAGRRAA